MRSFLQSRARSFDRSSPENRECRLIAHASSAPHRTITCPPLNPTESLRASASEDRADADRLLQCPHDLRDDLSIAVAHVDRSLAVDNSGEPSASVPVKGFSSARTSAAPVYVANPWSDVTQML